MAVIMLKWLLISPYATRTVPALISYWSSQVRRFSVLTNLLLNFAMTTNLQVEPLPTEQAKPTFFLAHPCWIVGHQVGLLARRAVGIEYTSRRKALRLNACFRLVLSPEAAAAMAHELSLPEFYQELRLAGENEDIVSALQFLQEMALTRTSPERFAALQSHLKKLLPALREAEKRPESNGTGFFKQERFRRQGMLLAHYELELTERQRTQALARAEAAAREKAEAARKKEEAAVKETARVAALTSSFSTWVSENGIAPDHFPVESFEHLQSPPNVARHVELFGAKPTLTQLRKQFGLKPAQYKALCAYKQERDALARREASDQREAARAAAQAARDAALRQKAWEAELVISTDLPPLLGITKTEYEQWRKAGRIRVSKWKEFRKWGRSNQVAFHHPEDFNDITQEQIQQWREAEEAMLSLAAKAARKRAVERAQVQQEIAGLVRQVECDWQAKPILVKAGTLSWTKTVAVAIEFEGQGGVETWPAKLEMSLHVPMPKTPAEVLALPARALGAFCEDKILWLTQKLSVGVSLTVAKYRDDLTSAELTDLVGALKAGVGLGVSHLDIEQDTLAHVLDKKVRSCLDRLEAVRAQALLKLEDFPQAFPLARSLEREIHFRVGGTNSGKTHGALEALKAAKSGIYLAPLRLLAMEIRDRLSAAGIACSLMTGEEHDIVPGATHTACTVEMLDPSQEVEVAVIDEIQMLEDEARGWAWTSALIGTPAKNVYVCGGASVLEPCLNVITAVGERHTVTRLERQTPLSVMAAPVNSGKKSRNTPNGIQAGDAIIAFSRKDVLTWSARLRQRGFTVSTIYGALAPEVRRREAERFASGSSEIVVATDAIGLGLNLPIRRVIFSTCAKYDGRSTRSLYPVEVQQIGGRAGRMGLHPQGFVGALDGADLRHVSTCLHARIDVRLKKLPIAPSFWHIETLSQLRRTTDIGCLLTYFAKNIAVNSSLFETARLSEMTQLGWYVDQLSREMSLNDKFTFSCAPVSQHSTSELAYFKSCLESYVQGQKKEAPSAPSWLEQNGSGNLEEAEQLSKKLSLYAWLSFKYPQTFHQGASIAPLREEVSRYIERALLKQSGFGETSKESYQARSSRYY